MSTMTDRHEVVVDRRIAEAMKNHARIEQRLGWAERRESWHRDEGEIEELQRQLSDAAVEVWEAQADYDGWSRFFLVQNTNGHIHRDMSCSTCFPDTQYGWLYELSGLTEAEAVEEYGEILCSVCYPSAPVEWTRGENKKVAAERELHKALTAIQRSPEGKKVKSATELVRSKEYRIDQAERAIARHREDIERGAGGDGTIPLWVVEKAAKAEQDLPKLRKQLARAQDKLAAAEAALEEALT